MTKHRSYSTVVLLFRTSLPVFFSLLLLHPPPTHGRGSFFDVFVSCVVGAGGPPAAVTPLSTI